MGSIIMRGLMPLSVLNSTRPALHGARVSYLGWTGPRNLTLAQRLDRHFAQFGAPSACILLKYADDDARSASAPSVCDTARTLDTARSDATGRPRRSAKSRLDAISRKMKHPSRESDAPRRRRASARPPPGPQPVSQVARDRMNRARRPKALPAWAQAPPRDE